MRTMGKPARLLAAVAAATAIVLALTACSAGTGPATSAKGTPDGTYVLGLAAPASTLNPLTVSDANAMFMVGLASAGLVVQTPTGQLRPQLATSWTESKDKLHWTLQLRDGVKFSDGQMLTPADVVATFRRIIDPKSTSPAASAFAGILGAVAAGDGNAVIFTLDKPYHDFPYLLTGANTDILPATASGTDWISHPVGAGQFLLKSYTPGQGATYVKNPNYWDAAHIDLAGVDVKFYSDPQSQLLAFQSGEVDQIGRSPAVTAALSGGHYRVFTQGYLKFDGLTFNTKTAPFDDRTVRQAIAWALDRDAIVNTVYGGAAVPGNDVATFPDYAVQPKLTVRTQNVDKVRELLHGRTISFTITTYTAEQPLAELIQQQLQAVGGFTVKLDIQTSAQYYGGSSSTTPWLNAPVTITDWGDRLPAQLTSLAYGSGSAWNGAHYANPALDALNARYEATPGEAGRQRIADQIAQIQWADVPIIVPAFVQNGIYLAPTVHGTFRNGQDFNGGYDFRGITVG